MTTYIEDIRKYLYFTIKAFNDIYMCFDYYITKELAPKKNKLETDKMNLT